MRDFSVGYKTFQLSFMVPFVFGLLNKKFLDKRLVGYPLWHLFFWFVYSRKNLPSCIFPKIVIFQ